MRKHFSPAPLPLRLSVRLLPEEVRKEVLGDLLEQWKLVARDRHWLGRVVWAWRQPASALVARVRFRQGSPEEHGSAGDQESDTVLSFFRKGANDLLASVSWLDFKLGFRMLIKHPGLTVVAGLAMAFAIMVGAGSLEFFANGLYPQLNLDEGKRIVEIRNHDISTRYVDPRALHDFVAWRDELRSVQEIGAFQTFRRNLATEQGRVVPLFGAEMTAAAFSVARMPPILGRSLGEADEAPGAPNVLLIGFDVWNSVFGGDPDVVGQRVRLGSEFSTVVGVMPEGFGWPWSHDLWAPFRLDPLDFERGESPAIQVVARLAPGVRLSEARAEVEAVGRRNSADYPDTHERLRAEVVRYGTLPFSFSGLEAAALYLMQAQFYAVLMVLVCSNVALLIFARTAARESEIVLRTALGASRQRIVGQLVVEALVLGSLAAILGLWGAQAGLTWFIGAFSQLGSNMSGGEVEMGLIGFWFDGSLSIWTVLCTMLFTILGAICAGVAPALKMTGRGVQPRLQRAGTGGSGLGGDRIWGGVIVTQIALTVAFVPFAIVAGVGVGQIQGAPFGFPAEEYLSVQFAAEQDFYSLTDLIRNRSQDPGDARYLASLTELKRRVGEEPTVTAVTVASQVPGAVHSRRWIDVEAVSAPRRSERGHRVDVTAVDLDFFDALGTSFISGRGFDAADLGSGQNVVVVNEDFVRVVLGGRNPIGRRISFGGRRAPAVSPAANPGPWYEIVGVVRQIAMTPPNPEWPDAAGIYQLLGPTEAYPLHMAIHVGRDQASFARRLQELATEVDPTLQVDHVQPLNESSWVVELIYRSVFWALVAGGGIAVLLSNAGIFSIMSFTVSRRTREIGVRVALGADRSRIVKTVSSRALKQIGLGVGAGGALLSALLLWWSIRPDIEYRAEAVHGVLVVAHLAVMTCVCTLACIVPMRRALGVEPTEALRAEG